MNGETRWLTMAAWFGIIALMGALASPLTADASSQISSTPQKDANPVVLEPGEAPYDTAARMNQEGSPQRGVAEASAIGEPAAGPDPDAMMRALQQMQQKKHGSPEDPLPPTPAGPDWESIRRELKAEPATKVDLLNLKDELKSSMTSMERWLIGIVLGVQGVAASVVIGFMIHISRRLGALEKENG